MAGDVTTILDATHRGLRTVPFTRERGRVALATGGSRRP
jgi:hypothetical protein